MIFNGGNGHGFFLCRTNILTGSAADAKIFFDRSGRGIFAERDGSCGTGFAAETAFFALLKGDAAARIKIGFCNFDAAFFGEGEGVNSSCGADVSAAVAGVKTETVIEIDFDSHTVP